jgi:hypothetical protein
MWMHCLNFLFSYDFEEPTRKAFELPQSDVQSNVANITQYKRRKQLNHLTSNNIIRNYSLKIIFEV